MPNQVVQVIDLPSPRRDRDPVRSSKGKLGGKFDVDLMSEREQSLIVLRECRHGPAGTPAHQRFAGDIRPATTGGDRHDSTAAECHRDGTGNGSALSSVAPYGQPDGSGPRGAEAADTARLRMREMPQLVSLPSRLYCVRRGYIVKFWNALLTRSAVSTRSLGLALMLRRCRVSP